MKAGLKRFLIELNVELMCNCAISENVRKTKMSNSTKMSENYEASDSSEEQHSKGMDE